MNTQIFSLLGVCALVSSTTGFWKPGSWKPSLYKSYVDLYTPNHYDYIDLAELGVEVQRGQTSFKFQVRANNDAHVVLLESAGDTSHNVFEIVIGGWRNSRSVIRNKLQGPSLSEVSHSPLDGSEFREFWISWKDEVISVGTGEEQFLEWNDANPCTVNYIAVSTGFGSDGEWRFRESINDHTVSFSAGDNYIYHSFPELKVSVKFQKAITFSVRASNDAHIALLRDEGDTSDNMYEIVIGGWGNSQSVIREEMQGATLAHAYHRPLSADRFAPFWISFSAGTISVGYGDIVGRRIFMSWRDPTPTRIGYISVATGWGATGQWLLTSRTGLGGYLCT